MTASEEIGEITHFFGKISVAVIKINSGSLKVGETIRIVGATTDFTQAVDSMQIEHKDVEEVTAGQDAGIKVSEPVRAGDKVYKVMDQ